MRRLLRILLLAALFVFGPVAGPARGAGGCPEGNLLDVEHIVRALGVIREQRLFDGRIPGEGMAINDYNATLFIGRGAVVEFDLGATHEIDAADVLTNDYASPLLEWSADGISYQPVRLGNAQQLRAGLRQRWAASLALEARFLRLRPDTAGGTKAVAELRVFCREPDGFPTLSGLGRVQPFKTEIETLQDRNAILNFLYLAFALGGAAVCIWMRRLAPRHRNALALLIVIAGSLGWIRFGHFAGAGELLHPHDVSHYYLGAKYFQELGYRDLYRCIARSERENGRGFMVDRARIRDLDDYMDHPGSWTRRAEGRCRADFTEERWRRFASDVDMVRRLFTRRHFHGMLVDHGYNATPLHTAWLETATNSLPASRAALNLFALLDITMTVAAIAFMWWGFGPVAASVAALVLGLSELSSYNWIGGSLGRAAWLMALCAGAACLKRGYAGTGTGLVTLAMLLRLVPGFFLGALGLWVLVRLARERRFAAETRRMTAAFGVVLAAGLSVPLVAFGPGVYQQFVSNTLVHLGNVAVNNVGLGVLLAAAGSPGWLDLTVRAIAVLAGIVFIVHVSRLDRPAWSVMPLGGLLLFAALGLGYDYAWLIVLAPLAAVSAAACIVLLGFVAITNLSINLLSTHDGYILLSAALLFVLPAVVYLGHRTMGPLAPLTRAAERTTA